MYEYSVRPGYDSGHLLVEFRDMASDAGLRNALATALAPIGVAVKWDGNYLLARRTIDGSLDKIYVESDEWDCVWGHYHGARADERVAELDELLSTSGLFVKVPWDDLRKPRSSLPQSHG
jgi:hypothetical protein